MDVHDKYTRSYNMSKISSKNTSIELIVRQFLFNNKFRYRIHYKKLPGKPDIVFPKQKIVIFINGCYFHRHKECRLAAYAETNKNFWKNKIDGNVNRDKINEELLKEMNWSVIKIWECEIEPRKKKSPLRETILENLKDRILKLINENDTCN